MTADLTTPSGPLDRLLGRVRAAVDSRRAWQVYAETEVARDEEAMAAPKRRSITLGDAGKQFWRHPSPWMLLTMLVGTVTARAVVGGFAPVDVVLPLVLLAVSPFVEWTIHVFILHARPRALGPLTIDTLLARKHREHHVDPRDIPLIFIPWQALIWIIVGQVALILLAFPRLATGLTYGVTLSAFGLAYEWTHYLIHTDYRPVSGAYRSIWRNHRLHHYKNEKYWFSVTTAGISDRLLRTYPDPATVETSPTARNLHGAA